MATKTFTAQSMEIIKKYPELEKRVNDYIETVSEGKKKGLAIDALKVLEGHSDVKPLEGIFKASTGDEVPEEVMAVLKKYPEFEESVNAYLEKVAAGKKLGVAIDALNVFEGHEDVAPVEIELEEYDVKELMKIVSNYPDAEAELKEHLAFVERQKKLNLSPDALKVLEK